MSLRLAQQYLTEHTEPTEKNNLNFMNPSAASYLHNYGRPAVYSAASYLLNYGMSRTSRRIL